MLADAQKSKSKAKKTKKKESKKGRVQASLSLSPPPVPVSLCSAVVPLFPFTFPVTTSCFLLQFSFPVTVPFSCDSLSVGGGGVFHKQVPQLVAMFRCCIFIF